MRRLIFLLSVLVGGGNVVEARLDLLDAIERTGLKGKSVISIDVFPTKREMLALFEVAKYLEPFKRTGGLSLLPGKVLATLAFEPSTRTVFGLEAAMHRLGGAVMALPAPSLTTRMASGESLRDTFIILSKYANAIGMRHPNAKEAFEAAKAAEVPVFTCGFGDTEHPFQTCGDMYAIWRNLGKLDGLSVLFPAPEIWSSRVSHSLAYGLAKFGAKITFATDKEGRAQKEVVDRLKKAGVDFREVLDPSQREIEELVLSSDIVYLPSWLRGLPKEESEKKKYLEKFGKYRLKLEYLERAKKEKNKMVYFMHPGAKMEPEVDFRIDNTEHTLYWQEVEYSLPARMAVILSVLYGA